MEVPNYLFFTATFADGVQITQDERDASQLAEGRNAFFDVLQKQLDVPLVCFVLLGEGYPRFGVDLQDGHFEVNGVPFFQHSEPLRDFRLVYFRNVSQHRTMTQNGPSRDWAELGYEIGWTAEHKGEEIKRTIRVKK